MIALATTNACDAPETSRSAAPEAPTLAGASTTCRTAGQATHRARYCETEAQLRMAGYPFSPADGPRALAWLDEAVACHEAAGDKPSAQAATTRRAAFEARVLEDYRLLRLRLDQALAQHRRRDAGAEARALLALLSRSPPSAYVRWLKKLERRLP